MADVPVYDLGDPIWIEVVTVAETPPDLAGYGGRLLSVPNATVMPPLGARGVLRVSGVDVPGYLRQGDNGYEWVVWPPQSPLEVLVDSLPGPAGWSDLSARAVWLDIGSALLGLGVSSPALRSGLPALYAAAKANLVAEYGVTS